MENINETNETTEMTIKKKRSKFNLFVGIMLFVILFMVAVSYSDSRAMVKWEYMTLYYHSENIVRRTGVEAAEYVSIDASAADLNWHGSLGWEIVTSYLETETAYPNFGSDDYVTGIQPNIRPQRLVLILKRPIKN